MTMACRKLRSKDLLLLSFLLVGPDLPVAYRKLKILEIYPDASTEKFNSEVKLEKTKSC
jgi:hypothetical protein